MNITVIRRRRIAQIEASEAAPISDRVEVPKIVLTPEEERSRMMRSRDRRLHAEVLGEFRSIGARVFNGDPLRCAREDAVGGDS